jgi:hypothetical protein
MHPRQVDAGASDGRRIRLLYALIPNNRYMKSDRPVECGWPMESGRTNFAASHPESASLYLWRFFLQLQYCTKALPRFRTSQVNFPLYSSLLKYLQYRLF